MFTMNATLVKEADLEINAYLNSLSLHQSFEEEEDTEDDEFYTANPSGSVLQPTSNPYNKQRKIAEANETLFAEEVTPKSPQKVKFNKVEKRICYDYFGSSFESDSIKSYEDEESEKESVQQENNEKQKNEQTTLDVRGTHLQPRNPASKVVVTVTPKREEDQQVTQKREEDKQDIPNKGEDQPNSESESEDVCVGTITKSKESNPEAEDKEDKTENQEVTNETISAKKEEDDLNKANVEKSLASSKNVASSKSVVVNKSAAPSKSAVPNKSVAPSKNVVPNKSIAPSKSATPNRSVAQGKEAKTDLIPQNNKQSKEQDLKQTNDLVNKKNENSNKDKSEELVFLELEKPDTKRSASPNELSDFYPCLANHSGITIRITGADSIESVESESTDNEVQIEENYSTNVYNIVQFRPEDKTLISKTYQNSRVKETTYTVARDSFILKGTKSTQNIRSPKSSQRLQSAPAQRSNFNREENQKELSVSKSKTDKTDQPVLFKVHKSKPKQMSHKSKMLEDYSNKKTEECCIGSKKVRPKSCVEKESVKVKTSSRPLTAPVKRSCCQWGQPHLPEYNGLRSEYGLSAEQLMERKRHKIESLKMQKQRKEQKYKEEQEKRKENEAKFIAWLEDKRKQAQMQFLRNQKIQAESGIKLYPAPTAHLHKIESLKMQKQRKEQKYKEEQQKNRSRSK